LSSKSADEALIALLRDVEALGYEFVTVTPESHKRVLRGRGPLARDLRDIFGWSLPFEKSLLPANLWDSLEQGGMAVPEGGSWRSRVRISTIGQRYFLHSAFPTDAVDSVFLGPDSYRFAAFLGREVPRLGNVRRLVDVGAGAGVGAIVAAALAPGAQIAMTDVNPLALRFARINARHAGVETEMVECEGLAGIEGAIDLVIANPPFVVDTAGRAYRDGGAMHGAGLSLDWALEAAGRIEPGGTMLVYTGSAIADGRDGLRRALEERLPAFGCSLSYSEIDPDIFGELLDEPAYDGVERLAAIGVVISKG
jgi:hypothetical protein